MAGRWIWMVVGAVVACGESGAPERAPPFVCPDGVSREVCHTALAGEYSGTLQDGGTWRVAVDPRGTITGSVIDADGASHAISGYADEHGRLLMTGGELGFDGQVRIDGSLWGVWADAEWLRGFRGRRTSGPIVLGASAAGTGGSGAWGGSPVGGLPTGGAHTGTGGGSGGLRTGGVSSGATGATTPTGGATSTDGWGACYIECRPANVSPRRECAYLSGREACGLHTDNVCGQDVVRLSRHLPRCPCFDEAPGCTPEWW